MTHSSMCLNSWRACHLSNLRRRALFGTIKWGCSDARLKWEPSWKEWKCGRTRLHDRRLQASLPIFAAYEDHISLLSAGFFAMPRRLAVRLAECRYANWFHERAIHATREPFLRKEDDPLSGFWLYKCLREAGEGCAAAAFDERGRGAQYGMH